MLEIAKAAALAAGKIHMDNYGKTLNVDAKLKNDIKLEVDKLSEKAIIDVILSAHPDHSILGEEGGSIDNGGAYHWIIDPLDGTVNFFYGLPYFCTSIACFKAPAEPINYPRTFKDLGEPVCAAIYAAPTQEFIYAEAGKGAYLNDRPIHASTETKLQEALLCTGYGASQDSYDRMFGGGSSIAAQVRKIRCLGAAAYDIANVACGRATGFFEGGVHSWDIAAGGIIAQEAGAIVDAFETDSASCRWDTIIAAPALLPELKQILRGA